ncbi:MAG: class I SAM-dependent methyltransferase [Nitrospira sp.]|nr:class I SAM-dependent methyltransferase [Nitrospira sp.]
MTVRGCGAVEVVRWSALPSFGQETCYVCGGSCRKDVRFATYTYWKCADCFTSQVLPQPSSEDLRSYYDRYHQSEQVGGVYDEVEDRMKADFPTKVGLALTYAGTKHSRLLDVGCGKGFFVKAALDEKIRAEGIDLSRSGIEYAVNTLGVKATTGRIQDQQNESWKESFDVVTLWATVEHLPDPLSVLQAIHGCLKPGGILLCDTGLGHSPWEQLLPGHSQWYDAPQHLFVFSENGLVRLLEACGFSIVHVDTNFERSFVRRWVRWIRHFLLCFMGWICLGPFLGKHGLRSMRQQAKWPLGRLLSIVAKKKSAQVDERIVSASEVKSDSKCPT